MIIDSHCHLDYPGLADREEAVVAAAAQAGIGLMVTIATRRSTWANVLEIAARDRQAASFRSHIAAARVTGLPLIVHTREADEDTMDLLEEEMRQGPFSAVIHCFSSSRRLAERAVDLGFCLGIGGILTFPRSTELRQIVSEMPLDRLLLETDAPYLAPVPVRGRTNEPAFTTYTVKRLAELRELSIVEIEQATTANFFRLFTRAASRQPVA